MQLNVKNLAYAQIGSRETYEFSLDKINFSEDDGIQTAKGEVQLTRLDEGMLAEFQVDLRVVLNCDRCLDEFTFKPELKFQRLYTLKTVFSEDSDSLPVDKDFSINILDPIREEAILSIPTKKICASKCAGICPKCGSDLNSKKCKCGQKKY